MFDCCLPVAKEQREGLIKKLDDISSTLTVLDGGRQHEATTSALAVLRGQGKEVPRRRDTGLTAGWWAVFRSRESATKKYARQ